MATIELKKCLLKIQDGTSTPNVITVKVGTGNITYSIKRNIEYILDRGLIDNVREGDQVPMDVSFDIAYEHFLSDGGGGEAVTPSEALQKIGAAAAWTTSGADPCEPYAVDLIVDYNITCGSTKDEKYVFDEYRYESIDYDLGAGTIASSGKCNAVYPTVTRLTFSS